MNLIEFWERQRRYPNPMYIWAKFGRNAIVCWVGNMLVPVE